MSRLFQALAVLGLATSALTAAAPARAQQDDRPRPAALLVRPDPDKPSVPLRVAEARVQVTVVGAIATTRLDLTFRNDLDRVLEGELVLPLPRGATISHFAIEVSGGELRSASVVERERARVAFEEVVRRNVDPGLVEWTAGNNFRTRVFPIPAKGTKRLVLGYDQELRDAGSGRVSLVVPLGFGKLDYFTALVSAPLGGVRVLASFPELKLKQNEKNILEAGAVDARDVEPKDLQLEVYTQAAPEVAIDLAVRGAFDPAPEYCFVTRVEIPDLGRVEAKKPGRVTILWDASGSAAERDAAKERAFLERYLAALGTASLRLVVFSNDLWPALPGDDAFAVAEGKCPALLARLAAIRPDGGTRLGCLDLRKLDATSDAVLLFSDGLSTFGEGELQLGAKPVSCVTSGASADFRALERIARAGAMVNLAEISPEVAVTRVLEEPPALLGVDFDATRVADVYPAAPARLEGRSLTIAGRIRDRDEPAKLTLRFGRGGREVARREVSIPTRIGSVHVPGLARAWATRRIDALLGAPVIDEAAIVQLGKAYGIVTPFTSLLVLDTLDDYVKHRVVPPKDLEDKYWETVEREKAAAAKTRDERLAAVRTKWQKRLEWWKKEFKYPEGFKWDDPAQKGGLERARRGGDVDSPTGNPQGGDGATATGTAPPPTPALEPAPAQGGFGGASLIPTEREEVERLALGQLSAEQFAKKLDGKSAGSRPDAIALKPWDPKTPYIEAYKKSADAAALYTCYLDQRALNAASTAFYLDSADYFYAQGLPQLALRILSNLAELRIESAPLLRILGYRLKQAGEVELAIATFKHVARVRPEEPQSWRDMGLAQAEAKRWADAVAALERVVLGTWDGRFPDVEVIALGELNDVLARAKAGGVERKLHSLPDDLVVALDTDLRIVLTWDADACDMDLWVVEPSGEKAFYGHTLTTIGGAFGRAFTGGYGPEEYLVRKAMPGAYKIQVNYYGNRQQILAGDTTIQVTVIKNFGRKDEERREVTRRLKGKQEVLDVAEVVFGAPAEPAPAAAPAPEGK